MMKGKAYVLIMIATLFLGWSCNDDDDLTGGEIPGIEDVEIENFIWNGLNIWYLWQPNVPDLADDRFTSEEQYLEFLKSESSPEDFFESLIYNRQSVDFWSWIVDDYIEQEKQFQGITKSNGVDFGLARVSPGSNEIIGYVRYIMNDSDASDKDIERGDAFTHVNETELSIDNYRDLLFSDLDSYTLDLATVTGTGEIIPNGRSVDLTKFEYTENPVLISKVFEYEGKKIGYIMFNHFFGEGENILNPVFLEFKNEGITNLILDLRYNQGGFQYNAISLASMMTGQFTGEVFTTDEYNPKVQAEVEASNPELLVEKFTDKLRNGQAINSLNLNEVHILVTGSSASASEQVISALDPYIDVTLVGAQTSGKYTGSITLYDSENFRREGANPDHFYAMQPIVFQSVNSLGVNDKDGYEPDIEKAERLSRMGVLGQIDEPLLRAAINDIVGVSAKFELQKPEPFEYLSNSKQFSLTKDNLYIDKPEIKKFLYKQMKDKK